MSMEMIIDEIGMVEEKEEGDTVGIAGHGDCPS